MISGEVNSMKDDRSYTTKKLVINALLLALGLVLHYITPPLGFIQMDFSLVTMVLIVSLNKDKLSTAIIAGFATGIFDGMTSKFVGGLMPNIIDKLVTAMIVFALIRLLNKTRLSAKVKTVVVNAVGTIVSGTVFLVSALLLVGLPAPFGILFIAVVLPTTIANTVVGFVVNGIFEKYGGDRHERQ